MSRYVAVALFVGSLCLLAPRIGRTDEVKAAIAANFSPVMKELQKDFEQKTGHKLTASFGSSGAFYAQIRNGAPFDVFLSADAERPKKLEEEKLAVAGSRFTYATGKLVLWSPEENTVDTSATLLLKGQFKKLAIADPKTAPYGAAARETLQALKLWDRVSSQVVQGVDIGQTYQFIASGNAKIGFVAYSQILVQGKPRGSFWLVPAKLYSPIQQQAVLLVRGKDSSAAQAFLDFLKSKEAKDVMASFGYEVR